MEVITGSGLLACFMRGISLPGEYNQLQPEFPAVVVNFIGALRLYYH